MMRGLQLPALSKGACRALHDLDSTVRELGCAPQWLDLIEREFGYVIAATRLEAQERAERREQEREEATA
jgi:hypothetical protein